LSKVLHWELLGDRPILVMMVGDNNMSAQ